MENFNQYLAIGLAAVLSMSFSTNYLESRRLGTPKDESIAISMFKALIVTVIIAALTLIVKYAIIQDKKLSESPAQVERVKKSN